MKKMVILLVLLLTFSVVVAQELDLNDEQEDAVQRADTMEACVRYLKSEYPNAANDRIKITCERLRAALRNRVEVRERIEQNEDGIMVRQEIRERFEDMDEDQKMRMKTFTRVSQEKMDDLPLNLRERLANLSDEQKEKLEVLSRSRIRELAQDGTLEEKIQEIKIREYASKAEMFRKRTVLDYQQLRNRVETLNENYGELVSTLNSQKMRFRNAIEDDDDEVAMEAAKEYLTTLADTIVNTLERIKINVQSNDDLSEDEVTDIVTKIDEQIATILLAKEDVQSATTKEEIKEAGKEIIAFWRLHKPRIEAYAATLVKAQVFDTVRRAEFMEKKLDAAIVRLQDAGYDTQELEDLIDQYSDAIANAKEKYQQAQEIIAQGRDENDEDLIEEGKDLIEDAHEDLKDANEILQDIIEEIRELAGSVDYLVEANVDLKVEVDEDEIDDAQEEIEKAREEIEKARQKIDEASVDGKETEASEYYYDLGVETLKSAQDAFDNEDWENAEELAEDAKDYAQDARMSALGKTLDEFQDNDDKDSDDNDNQGLTELEVNFHDNGTATLEIEYNDEKEVVTIDASSEDDVYSYLKDNYDVTDDDIATVIEIEESEEEMEEENSDDMNEQGLTEVKVEFYDNGTADLEIEYNDEDTNVTITATTLEDVYSYLVDTYTITQEEAEQVVKI